MAGEDTDGDDPCPLCGGPARVTLSKRRLFPADTSAAMTMASAARADEASSALRESLARQRRDVAGLQADLDAERAAAADAASEAMSMILRLQRDKSEAMMEARQYRRYAEERFAHDAAEADALRAALARRDAAVGALSARLRKCQARLLHLGFESPSSTSLHSPFSPTGSRRAVALLDHRAVADDDDEYPPSVLDEPSTADVGTPRTHHLLNRVPGQDPPPDNDPLPFPASPLHARKLSIDGFSSYDDDVARANEYPLYATPTDHRGRAPDHDEDEAADRVYTVDAVHGVPVAPWAEEDDEEEASEMQKLKARLQALEADRESMRHAIVSMGDEKAQLVLLREIAQQLCREGAMFPAGPMKVHPTPQPVVVAQRKVVRRQPCFLKVFIVTVIKWIASIFCWRRKPNHIKYPIGLCGSNVGLMLVLDRYTQQKRRRFIKRTLVQID